MTHVVRSGPARIYINTSVLLCIYMHKSGWTREVRARMNRSTHRKLIVNPFSIITQTKSIGQQGSELTDNAGIVPQVCFVGVQPSQKMIPRKSHGDGSDCPLCTSAEIMFVTILE